MFFLFRLVLLLSFSSAPLNVSSMNDFSYSYINSKNDKKEEKTLELARVCKEGSIEDIRKLLDDGVSVTSLKQTLGKKSLRRSIVS